jgi:hypothetical protein
MGVASPLFTKSIEPAADALITQVQAKTRPVAATSVPPVATRLADPSEDAGEVQP